MGYWAEVRGQHSTSHGTREGAKELTRPDPYVSMFVHSVCVVLLCLLFPLLEQQVVTPIVLQIFGSAHEVLSMSVLTTMAVMLISVLFVPTMMFLVTRSARRVYVPIYMGGANMGDNTYFVNS